jgi:hypothetical protein
LRLQRFFFVYHPTYTTNSHSLPAMAFRGLPNPSVDNHNPYGQQFRGDYPAGSEATLGYASPNASQVPLAGAGAFHDQQGQYDNYGKLHPLHLFRRSLAPNGVRICLISSSCSAQSCSHLISVY